MTTNRDLILSSFSRVGLSLPIDGSKDEEIKIQACEHLPFKPILNELDHDDNSMVKEDIEAKRSEIKPTPNEIEYPMKILRENSENIKPKAKRRRRVLPDCLFSLPAPDKVHTIVLQATGILLTMNALS